jgi:endonuclease/exonuclease/phosphatase family metal-dependent hydrolase
MRIMTWNLHLSHLDESALVPRLSLIGQVIREQRPDVLAVQEAPAWRTFATFVTQELDMDLRFAAHRERFHLAVIFQKGLHVREAQTIEYAAQAKPVPMLIIAGQDQDRTPLTICSVHLRHGRGVDAEAHRTREIEQLIQALPTPAEAPQVLAGDFNALAPGDPVGRVPSPDEGEATPPEWTQETHRTAIARLLDAHFHDGYRTIWPNTASTPGWTYLVREPYARYDYLFASSAMPRLRSCTVVALPPDFSASDHFPVISDFG